MKRGDMVLAVAPGDYGKPRPSVVVQSDLFNPTHESVIVCLLTTELKDSSLLRLTVEPSPENGLQAVSQIMVDKLLTLPKKRLRDQIGVLEDDMMAELNGCLRLVLAITGS